MRKINLGDVLCLMTALVIGSCASGPKEKPKVSYQSSAKANYLKGKKEFDSSDYLKATEYFRFVKNRYPYSTYATMSDLMLAECEFERDHYLEAADGYNNFIKLHPKHKKVPYAMFRIGICYFERIPDDWWFAPPAFERDQSETIKAVDALQQYLRAFPQDEHAAETRKLLHKARLRMAKRVHYTMNFYRDHDRPRGALWRANELLKDYADLDFTEEAMYCKAEALAKIKDHDHARDAVAALLEKYPHGKYANRAKKLAEKLKDKKPDQGSKKPKQSSEVSSP